MQILMKAGVSAASAHLLSNHYNLTRTEYYRQLEMASKSGGDLVPFLVYATQGLLDGLKEQLDAIWSQQWDITWRNYVHEFFRDKTSKADIRRRHLVLDISRRPDPVPFSLVPEITPRMAKAYARVTSKTITRDMNALVEYGLIEREDKAYRARKEIILSFMPPRAKSVITRQVF